MSAAEVKALYEGPFRAGGTDARLRAHLAAVERVAGAGEAEFRSPGFQRWLWESGDIADLGPGNSVTVPGAYDDRVVVDALWALRRWRRPAGAVARGRSLDAAFAHVLGLVHPRHSPRRPKARLVRLFAALFPQDALCLLDADRTAAFRDWLGVPAQGMGFVGQHALAREALRQALGAERGAADWVRHSRFSWFAWEAAAKPQGEVRGEGERDGGDDPAPAGGDAWAAGAAGDPVGTRAPGPTRAGSRRGGAFYAAEEAGEAPRLRVLRPEAQRKAMPYVAGNVGLLLSLARAAENGAERDDLLHHVREEAPGLGEAARRTVLSQAVGLGVLALEAGTYRPTPAGRGLLEGLDPAEVLVPAMARTVHGFADLIRVLDGAGGALPAADLAARLRPRAACPAGADERRAHDLMRWAQALGVAEVAPDAAGTRWASLTEDGERWAGGLPPMPAAFPATSAGSRAGVARTTPGAAPGADPEPSAWAVPDPAPRTAPDPAPAPWAGSDPDPATGDPDEPARADANPVAPSVALAPPAVDDVLSRLRARADAAGFVVPERQVRLLHAALHAAPGKRFALLSGLSGTGKTWLARAYAHAYCDALGRDPAAHCAEVAVWPDWTDPSGLLGYVDLLSGAPSFRRTPALNLLLAADRDRGGPYFLLLDEMNLARAEHYLAPFLSAMEGAGRLALHAGAGPVDGVPAAIAWPANLFVFGTVNLDETTHPLSDKVLDRAFAFEFWDVDLAAWAERAAHGPGADALPRVLPVLRELYDALRPARRHFGYRACWEVLGFCAAPSGVPERDALDAAVSSKLLPKLRGDAEGELAEALERAAAICEAHGLPASLGKLRAMQEQLRRLGAARFWS